MLNDDQEDAKEYQNYVKAYIKFEKLTNIDDMPIEQRMLSRHLRRPRLCQLPH